MKLEIKERKLTEGKRTLYLEYYETGFSKRENLHLYLLPDDAVCAAKHNRLTYNKAMREGLVKFNPVHSLNKLERFHAPDKHKEYLTP